jgi:NAD(P)-dependent dehydrogenase (short-subunit alcohol dehydrogenase family)
MSDFSPPDILTDDPGYKAAGKLTGKVAIITGGDSGIGAAAAIAFAKEGAKVVINYLKEDQDALATADLIKKYGSESLLFKADIGLKQTCDDLAKKTIEHFGQIDILVNNAGTQTPQASIEDISEEQLERTFRTNIYSMFFLTAACLPHLKEDSSIINTTSVTAYRGSEGLLDYSSTKGAIVSFTRSLSQNLAKKKIRVNAIAPGPVITPLVITSFDKEKLDSFGQDQPLGRAAQPYELAAGYVYLASRDSTYVTGQILHINGGEVING